MSLSKSAQNTGALISTFAILLLLSYISFATLGFDDEVMLLASMGILFLCSALLCFLVMHQLRKANKTAEIDYLNLGIQRYILALFMIMYGIDKIFGNFFDYQLFALDSKLTDISEFQLAWYYFGKHRWLELVSGILEFIPGLLLLHRRTYYVASLMLIFVTSQVFMLNLFFKIGGVTFPAICILMACNIYIIYSQKERIAAFFRSLNFLPDIHFSRNARIMIKAAKWTTYVLAIFVIFIKAKPALFKSAYGRKYESLVGVYTLKHMTKNHMDYVPANDSLYYKDLYIEKQSRWNILRRFNDKTDAFILTLRPDNDSFSIYINKGGAGDQMDIIDSATVLKGVYHADKNAISLQGIQMNDTLQLEYIKQDIRPKEWFW